MKREIVVNESSARTEYTHNINFHILLHNISISAFSDLVVFFPYTVLTGILILDLLF